MPKDVDIVSCHSLHGPNVDPKGQPLVSCRMPEAIVAYSDDDIGLDKASCLSGQFRPS